MNGSSSQAHPGARPLGERAFAALVVAYAAILLLYYPATYAIDDESNILSLAASIGQGTVFLEQAQIDLDADLPWRGHLISKFSPLHAALLSPALLTRWRLAFLLSAVFAAWGAFIFRDMLRREALSSGWTVLYFANPGLLYYSRTLLAMVPAAVVALLGASLLFRPRHRPVLGALALGGAALLHLWIAPVAIALALGWWLERGGLRLRAGLLLILGALPAVVLLASYNWLTTGSPFLNAYWIIGVQHAFQFSHFAGFAVFYALSLLLAPPAGWAALVPRWAGNVTIPGTILVVVTLASSYYYRDGMGYGVAGWVPGQRFLLPASLLACVPAARYLAALSCRFNFSARVRGWLLTTAVGVCIAVWLAISVSHQAYLQAQAAVQAAIRTHIPSGARVIGNSSVVKAFAPVNGRWTLRQFRDGEAPPAPLPDGAYVAWLGPPRQPMPPEWLAGRSASVVPARSWVWNRDLWIAPPVHTDRAE